MSYREKIQEFKQIFDSYRLHPRMIDLHGRLNRNHRFFSGLNGGQWSAKDSAEADSADRIKHTINLILPNIEQLVGDLMSNPASVDFLTDIGEWTGDTDLLKDLFDADYNLGKYKTALTEYTRDVLIHTGVLQIFPNMRYSDKGNIGLRRVAPSEILFDPYWNTDDMMDCPRVFRAPWASIEQIRDLCRANSVASDAIDRAYENFKKYGASPEIVADYRRDITGEYYQASSSQFRLIECIYMAQEKRASVRRVDNDSEISSHSTKAEADARLSQLNAIHHQNSLMYRVIENTVSVCRVFTFCPGLDDSLVLEDALYPIQMGRMPFIIRSSHNNLGERQGVVDLIIDPQVQINKRESSATEVLDKTARGNLLCETDAFGEDGKLEASFKRDMNKSGQLLKVAPGTLAENKIREMIRTQAPTELWSSADRAVAYLERILGLTAARQGESKSHDSAILFNDQVAQAEIKMFLLNMGLSDTLDQLGDMYFFGAKDRYAGDARTILNPRNGKLIKLNAPQVDEKGFPVLKNGKPVIHNDMASIPRFVVKIEQAKHGLTVRKRYLGMYTELLGRVRNPLLAARYEYEQVRYLGLPDSKVAQMEEECEIYIEFNKLQMLASISDLKLKMAQNDQAQKAIANPPPPPPQGGLPGLAGPMQSAPNAGMGALPGGSQMAASVNAPVQ